jgi:hypothetical protein
MNYTTKTQNKSFALVRCRFYAILNHLPHFRYV